LALAKNLIAKAKEKGIEIRLIEGYRSFEQQEAAYAQRLVGTRFTAHSTGLAFDFAVVKAGKLAFEGPEYDTVGSLGEQLGLVWGGRWPRPDKPHFETEGAKEALRKLRESRATTPSS